MEKNRLSVNKRNLSRWIADDFNSDKMIGLIKMLYSYACPHFIFANHFVVNKLK